MTILQAYWKHGNIESEVGKFEVVKETDGIILCMNPAAVLHTDYMFSMWTQSS